MSDIEKYVHDIENAVKGKEVRSAIANGIRQCYEDGKAGEVDLIAREGVTRLNEQKADAIKLDKEISDRSNSDMAINARIDNLVISEGGDSPVEVTDSHVGYDGTQYTTLKSRLDAEKLDTQKEFLDITNCEKIKFSEVGSFLYTSESPIKVPDSVRPNESYQYAYVPCQKGDVFTLNIRGGGSGRAWCFVDENGNIIDGYIAQENSRLSDFILIAPSNAAHLVLNNDIRYENKGCYRGHILKDDSYGLISDAAIYDYKISNITMPGVFRISGNNGWIDMPVKYTASFVIINLKYEKSYVMQIAMQASKTRSRVLYIRIVNTETKTEYNDWVRVDDNYYEPAPEHFDYKISNLTESRTYYVSESGNWEDYPNQSYARFAIYVQRISDLYIHQRAYAVSNHDNSRPIYNRLITNTGEIYSDWTREDFGMSLTDVSKHDYLLQNIVETGVYSVSAAAGWLDNPFGNSVINKNATMMVIPFSSSYVMQFMICTSSGGAKVRTIKISDHSLYRGQSWVGLSDSFYRAKKVSILGDSISTFAGSVPQGNSVYYTGSNCGVTSVDDTWWKKAFDALDMEILVNNSWSGISVSNVSKTEIRPAACEEEYIRKLGTETENPDVIVVKLGINDFNNRANLGEYDCTTVLPTTIDNRFRECYAIMLDNIMKNFPLAEIWCCTLMACERTGDVGFPEINAVGNTIKEYNDAIREIAEGFGAKIIDHGACGITQYNLKEYTGDWIESSKKGLHPNAAGHSLIANETIRTMDNCVRTRY